MTVNFSGDPTAIGFFAPTRFESDVFDCEVDGEIPKDLHGTFYRVGMEWMYPPRFKDDATFFNGDGFVGMFRFANGSVDYKGRYVRTPRYLANAKARKQLFGRYRNRYTCDPSVRDLNITVANTSMYTHAGKLWALKEDSRPFEMDPHTLETKGEWDFDGKFASKTFSAHPKTDPVTGELVCYGFEATGDASDDVFVYFVDNSGRVTREIRFKTPVVSMMHDIALTQKHIVFNTCGLFTSMDLLRAGKVHWAWDPKLPTYVGIMPRDGDAKDIRWFKGPQSAAIHFMNGNTNGNKVIVETPSSDGNSFSFFPSIDGSPFDREKARTVIRRWTFDLGSKQDGWQEEILFPQTPGLLPRIDERFLSLPYRYGYMGYNDTSKPFDEKRAGNLRGRVSNSYARFDLHTRTVDSYFTGNVHSLAEPQFVPRKKDSPEGDGYIIGVASNYAEMRSELVIVDAQKMSDGDIARVKLPYRLGPQGHGWWASAEDIPFTQSKG